jgi:uncharacterized membrane protein YvbJ
MIECPKCRCIRPDSQQKCDCEKLMTCSFCGVQTLGDEGKCARCGQPFPVPKGTYSAEEPETTPLWGRKSDSIWRGEGKTNMTTADDQVKCPRCGSAQIHAEKRGWRLTTGFIGSSKIWITCLKCGHRFKPGAAGGGIGFMGVIFVIVVLYFLLRSCSS